MDSLSLLKEFLDEREIWSRRTWFMGTEMLVVNSLKADLSFSGSGDLFVWLENLGHGSTLRIGNIADPDFLKK